MTEPKRSAPRYVTRNSVGPNQPTPWQRHQTSTAGKPEEGKATQDQYLWAVLDRPCQVPGSRYVGKRGDDGRPLCTAKAEYTRFDWSMDWLGELMIDSLGFDPSERIEDETGREEYEAAKAAGTLESYLAAPVHDVHEDWVQREGYPIARPQWQLVNTKYGRSYRAVMVNGTPDPDYDALREASSGDWAEVPDFMQLATAIVERLVAAATDRNGRLDYRDVWRRCKAMKDEPEYVSRAAAKAGFFMHRPMPVKGGYYREVLPTVSVWTERRSGKPRWILPTQAQATAIMKIVRMLVWQRTNPQGSQAAKPTPTPQPTAPARVVRRRKVKEVLPDCGRRDCPGCWGCGTLCDCMECDTCRGM